MPDDIKTEGETTMKPESAPVTKFGDRGEWQDGKRTEADPKSFYGKGTPTE